MLDRILVPLDGSERAESVLGRLSTLLQRRDGEVVLLRVVELPTTLRVHDPRLLQEGRAEAKRYLAGIEERLEAQGARVHSVVTEGLPADAILAAAREQRADVIAMMTHGRSGIARFVLGSVAEKVVRGSDVPAIVMHAFDEGGVPTRPGETPFRKILVPLDGSDASRSVLGVVKELAKLYASQVVLLHVDEGVLYPPGSFGGGMGGVPVPPPSVPMTPPPAELLAPAESDLAQAGIKATILAAKGDAASQILEAVSTQHADLIAMATHGRSGFTRWVLGSVTEKVLRAAKAPLLVVREGAQPHAKVG
jgi:nucleotide-binding universal stress UspA family protein